MGNQQPSYLTGRRFNDCKRSSLIEGWKDSLVPLKYGESRGINEKEPSGYG